MGRGPRSFAQSCLDARSNSSDQMVTNKKSGALCEGTSFDLIIMMSCDEDDGRSGRSSRTQRCKSRPSIPGIRTSVIKQLVPAKDSRQGSLLQEKIPRREPGGFNEACQGFAEPWNHHPRQLRRVCDDAVHQEHPLHSDSSGNETAAYYVFI